MAAKGGDLKESNSGTAGSCEGPKEWSLYGGAATWTGCPRMALGKREAAWINTRDRAGGRMSVTEQLHLPALLGDAFEALEEIEAQVAAHEAERRKQEADAEKAKRGILT